MFEDNVSGLLGINREESKNLKLMLVFCTYIVQEIYFSLFRGSKLYRKLYFHQFQCKCFNHKMTLITGQVVKWYWYSILLIISIT
jgi:hypothetical protein